MPTPKRILIVEDNRVNQLVLRRLLEKAHHSCEVANDGQEALNKWTASPADFDLIFMDIEMPVMGGLEATQAIREREQQSGLSKRIPIVGLSAYTSSEFITETCKAGMDDYICKPCEKEKLYEIIKQLTTSQVVSLPSQHTHSDNLLDIETSSITGSTEEEVSSDVSTDSDESSWFC